MPIRRLGVASRVEVEMKQIRKILTQILTTAAAAVIRFEGWLAEVFLLVEQKWAGLINLLVPHVSPWYAFSMHCMPDNGREIDKIT